MTVQGWLDVLNQCVFLWAHPQELKTLIQARWYREGHDVLIIDTERLVKAHGARNRLAGTNTGATIFPRSLTRGRSTFQTIEQFPFDERRRARKTLANNVVEVCVLVGLRDVADFVVRVEQWRGPAFVKTFHEPS